MCAVHKRHFIISFFIYISSHLHQIFQNRHSLKSALVYSILLISCNLPLYYSPIYLVKLTHFLTSKASKSPLWVMCNPTDRIEAENAPDELLKPHTRSSWNGTHSCGCNSVIKRIRVRIRIKIRMSMKRCVHYLRVEDCEK